MYTRTPAKCAKGAQDYLSFRKAAGALKDMLDMAVLLPKHSTLSSDDMARRSRKQFPVPSPTNLQATMKSCHNFCALALSQGIAARCTVLHLFQSRAKVVCSMQVLMAASHFSKQAPKSKAAKGDLLSVPPNSLTRKLMLLNLAVMEWRS